MESDANWADNSEEAEVEVGVSAVNKYPITLAATHVDSELEDTKGKAKSRVAAIMAVFLTALGIRNLSTGSDEGVMDEDGGSNDDDVQEDMM